MLRMGLVSMVSMAAVLLAAADCGTAPVETPTLTALQRDVFVPRCGNAGCHGGSNPARGLDLVTDPHGALVGTASVEDPAVLLVDPGNPDGSLLFQVLGGSVGAVRQMPPGVTLPAEDLAGIKAWIEAGAAND